VEIEQEEKGGTVQVSLWLDEGLTGREVKILFNSARHCEVGKFLRGPIKLEYRLK